MTTSGEKDTNKLSVTTKTGFLLESNFNESTHLSNLILFSANIETPARSTTTTPIIGIKIQCHGTSAIRKISPFKEKKKKK